MATMTRSRARRRARGAALVEAAVVIPFFIVIFIALVFFSRLYIEKMRTMSDAKQIAWTYAMNNCEGQPPEIQKTEEDLPKDNQPSEGSTGVDSENAKYANGFPGSDTVSKGSNMATATIQGQVTTTDRSKIGTGSSAITKQVSSKAWVTCNETPVDIGEDGIGKAIKNAWGLLTSW